MPPSAFDEWLLRAADLKLNKQAGRSKPYKPAMLLAAILLIRKGHFADNLLTLSELEPVFDQVLAIVAPGSPGPTEHNLPFRHLASDAIWSLVPLPGEEGHLRALLSFGGRARDLLQHTMGVSLPDGIFEQLRSNADAAEQATRRVLRTYAGVFESWGLAGIHTAEHILMTWLGGAKQDPPLQPRSVDERAVEQWVQHHWAETPFARMGLQLSGRQRMTPVNVIDLLAFDPQRVEWWIIEIKHGNSSDAVIGQLARYRGWIAQEKQVPPDRARGVVLTDDVSEKLRLAMRTQVGAELWRYDPAMTIARVDT